jgi:hypothetical protein
MADFVDAAVVSVKIWVIEHVAPVAQTGSNPTDSMNKRRNPG